MKKIKALGLAIWLLSLFLINVSAVSASTNCEVKCCDTSGLGNTTCTQTDQYCASQANRAAGDLVKDCGLPFSGNGSNGTCSNSQTAVCCCANNFVQVQQTQQASKPSPISNEALTPLQFTPQVSVPNSDFQAGAPINVGTPSTTASGTIMRSDLLGRYVLSLYNYGLAIVGILAAIILMAGGLLWLTSGGSAAKIGQAKELLTGSIIGLIILVGAWMILNTINPNLTKLPSIDTLIINEIPYCCDSAKGNVLAVKGECPDSSKGCQNGETCTNNGDVGGGTGEHGTNAFSCINSGGSTCCEHVANDGKTRICMSFPGTICPPMPASWKYSTDYKLTAGNYFKNLYCGYERIVPYSDNCKDSIADCSNIKDGQTCPGDRKGYCYNKICWFGTTGNDTEPCGVLPYSKCDKDLEQNGKTCNGDQSWLTPGRTCGSGLSCCKFNADKTRVNK